MSSRVDITLEGGSGREHTYDGVTMSNHEQKIPTQNPRLRAASPTFGKTIQDVSSLGERYSESQYIYPHRPDNSDTTSWDVGGFDLPGDDESYDSEDTGPY